MAVTTDAGVTWTGVSPFASTVVIRFHSIRMRSATEAYVAGSDGTIYATFNAGSSWTLLASTGVTLYSLDVFSETQGTAGAIAGSQVYTIVSGKFRCIIYFSVFITYTQREFAFHSTNESAESPTDGPAVCSAVQTAYLAAYSSTLGTALWSAHPPTHGSAIETTHRTSF